MRKKLRKLKNKIYKFCIFTIAFVVFSVLISTFICVSFSSASLHDIFTCSRITNLENRPDNITKDIFVDACLIARSGGIGILTKNVVTKVAEKKPNWRFIVCVSKDKNIFKEYENIKNIKVVEIDHFYYIPIVLELIKKVSFGSIRDKLTQLHAYDNIVFDDSIDLIWDPTGQTTVHDSTNIPQITTIHDLSWFEPNGPDFLNGYNCLKHFRQPIIRKNILCSKQLIAVSNFTKKRILDIFHVAPNVIKVIPIKMGKRVFKHISMREQNEILTRYNLRPHQYFIFCSVWTKNKNIKNLILAFEQVVKTNPSVKLLLVGKHHSLDQYKFLNNINEKTKQNIVITNTVSDEVLNVTLQNALAFVHPSIYEGFGMPLIEAMSAGIPIACSNIASLPEIVGEAAIKFNPFNVGDIAATMQTLISDQKLRKTLIQKGYQQVKQYEDNDEMIDQYIELMEKTMK